MDPQAANDQRLVMCEQNLRAGMKLGPVSYRLTAEQAAKFTAVLGMKNYAAEEGAPAPATMRLQDYALLISQHFRGGSGGVHARHRTEFHQPLRIGQSIITTGMVTKTYHKRGKFYFELKYESRDAATNQVLTRQTITSVLLHDGSIGSEAG